MSKRQQKPSSMSASSRHFGNTTSKIVGASLYMGSSRLQQNESQMNAKGAQILLDGVDVTPRSLLLTRIKPSRSYGSGSSVKGKQRSKNIKVRSDRSSGTSLRQSSAAHSRDSNKEGLDHDNDSESSGESISLGSYAASTSQASQQPSTGSDAVQISDNVTESVDKADSDKVFASNNKQKSLHDDDNRMEGIPKLPQKSSVPNHPKTIYLTETKTEFIFQLRSICVSQELTLQHASVQHSNDRYQNLCASKSGCDSFKTGRCQTIQLDQKTKEVMTAPPATKDVACYASEWEIYDTIQSEDASNDNVDHHVNKATTSDFDVNVKKVSDFENADQNVQQQVVEIVDAVIASPACTLDLEHDIIEDLKAQRYALQARKKKNMSNTSRSSTLSRRFRSDGMGSVRSHAESKSVHRMDKSGRRTGSNPSSNSQSGVSISFGVSQAAMEGDSDSTGAQSSQRNSRIISSGARESGSREHIKRGNTAYARAEPNLDLGEIIAQQKTHKLMCSGSLKKASLAMERAVQQNIYHCQQVLYRDFCLLGKSKKCMDEESPSIADPLEKLWTFTHESCKDMTVTCLTWNTANEDLLAVGYAQCDMKGEHHQESTTDVPTPVQSDEKKTSSAMGMILFWSLKNPESPERTYVFSASVTCAEFSISSPYLLAVGFLNGIVSVYDIRRESSYSDPSKSPRLKSNKSAVPAPEPLATSDDSNGKHLDAVWQVRWVNKGSDRAENVVSISADGRVTEWNIKKELNYRDLMTLKRISNPFLGSDPTSDGIISSQSSGLCFDFLPSDGSVYFVGTEDGLVHKCSISYSEQYLSTYYGHAGPVYRLAISQFSENFFLTCGGDWNIKLWDQSKQHELVNFHSIGATHAVHDIAWCPSNPNMFAAVRENLSVEIWDLKNSILDPVTIYQNPQESIENQRKGTLNNMLQCQRISFAPSAPVLVVGDCEGNVSVYCVTALAQKSSQLSDDSFVGSEMLRL